MNCHKDQFGTGFKPVFEIFGEVELAVANPVTDPRTFWENKEVKNELHKRDAYEK